jgi:hypothetical protein
MRADEWRGVAAHRNCPAGLNSLAWHAYSENGLEVPAGTYVVGVRANAASGTSHRALAPLRLAR